MRSNTFHVIPEERHLSPDELTSSVELTSRPSSFFSDHSTQDLQASSLSPPPPPSSHNNHKLRTSPKCSSHPAGDDRLIRHGSHHSRPHQRRFYPELPRRRRRRTMASSPPVPPDSPSFVSVHPSARTYAWLFLSFAAFAMVHAILRGFESRHVDRTHATNVRKHAHEPSEKAGKIGERDIISGDNGNAQLSLLTSELLHATRSANENREGASAAANANSSPIVEASATVLTRTSQLSSLIANLGAGDVVECYVVTRMAHLTTAVSTIPLGAGSAGGTNPNNNGKRKLDLQDDETNGETTKQQEATTIASATTSSNPSSGSVLIRKSALAFRYRPRVASATMHSPDHSNAENASNAQKYFEITLEYGPQRTGSTKAFESMPMLHMDNELGSDPSINSNNKYVSWENEGKVYHSTHISSEWTEAYYMAPITGVVLEKILQRAVDYPRKRPRYQPFEVVSVPSGELIVKSSGSDDFVWEMFRDLADLYVEIDPILVPPKGKVQFYVADAASSSENENEEAAAYSALPKRRDPNPNVRRVKGAVETGRAALFYERFYNCATAIKTGDYSLYLPPVTAEPTSSPTEHSTGVPSSSPSVQSYGQDETANDTTPVDSSDVADHDEVKRDSPGNTVSDQYTPDAEVVEFNSTDSDDAAPIEEELNVTIVNDGDHQATDTNSLRHRSLKNREFPLHHREMEGEKEDVLATPYGQLSNPENSTLDENEPSSYDEPGLVLGKIDVNSSTSDSTFGEDEDIAEEDIAEAAEKAAMAAVEAAENAAVVAATNSSSAADSAAAASEAAKAAKKAADATVAARNKVASEGLVSGDGALVTSILSTCFSDPKYGILQKEQVQQSNMEGSDNAEGESGQPIQMRESVYAYIYLDGDSFFRLNLTAPYWGTTSILQTVPPPSLKPEGSSDAIDWAIFVFILIGTLFGFLVMLHQGGCVIIDKRLQFRWFFKPTLHDNVDSEYQSDGFLLSEEEDKMLKLGGGFPHSIGIDVIPTSMGGMLRHYSDNVESGLHPAREGNSSSDVLLEMTCQRSANESGGTGCKRDSLPSSLRIRRDAPDNVERPSLITTSKPALPQQSPRNDCEATVKCDVFEDIVHDNCHPNLPFE